MTDKQIINGIDVSGCDFYIDSKNLEYNCKQTPQSYFCKNNPDCHYKQLKAKEQECERLKHDNDYEVGALEKTIDNLKAELEQERTLKEMYFTYYKANHGDIKGKLFRYKQALAEIKDFVENEIIPNEDTHIILQLINEVKND